DGACDGGFPLQRVASDRQPDAGHIGRESHPDRKRRKIAALQKISAAFGVRRFIAAFSASGGICVAKQQTLVDCQSGDRLPTNDAFPAANLFSRAWHVSAALDEVPLRDPIWPTA